MSPNTLADFEAFTAYRAAERAKMKRPATTKLWDSKKYAWSPFVSSVAFSHSPSTVIVGGRSEPLRCSKFLLTPKTSECFPMPAHSTSDL